MKAEKRNANLKGAQQALRIFAATIAQYCIAGRSKTQPVLNWRLDDRLGVWWMKAATAGALA
jgi:hypothetical protein